MKIVKCKYYSYEKNKIEDSFYIKNSTESKTKDIKQYKSVYVCKDVKLPRTFIRNLSNLQIKKDFKKSDLIVIPKLKHSKKHTVYLAKYNLNGKEYDIVINNEYRFLRIFNENDYDFGIPICEKIQKFFKKEFSLDISYPKQCYNFEMLSSNLIQIGDDLQDKCILDTELKSQLFENSTDLSKDAYKNIITLIKSPRFSDNEIAINLLHNYNVDKYKCSILYALSNCTKKVKRSTTINSLILYLQQKYNIYNLFIEQNYKDNINFNLNKMLNSTSHEDLIIVLPYIISDLNNSTHRFIKNYFYDNKSLLEMIKLKIPEVISQYE